MESLSGKRYVCKLEAVKNFKKSSLTGVGHVDFMG